MKYILGGERVKQKILFLSNLFGVFISLYYFGMYHTYSSYEI